MRERQVRREIEHYNLDAIISVGYWVKPQRGLCWRQWAARMPRWPQAGPAGLEHDKRHHVMYGLVCVVTNGVAVMRTPLNIDDQLLDKAQRIIGVTEKSVLVREGLRALIERESARRLARLGGNEPQLEAAFRRRPDPA